MTSLADIIKQNDFLSLTSNNRILCSYTKHEMPARLDCVLNHLNSKGLKKAKEWYSYDYSEFLPYIIQDKHNNKKLHCKLTQQTLNKIPDEIKKHIQGRKFLRLKKEYEDRKNNKNNHKTDENDDDEVDFWVPPDEDDEDDDDNIDINPTKKLKKNIEEDDDEVDDIDENDEVTEKKKHTKDKTDEDMDFTINKDDEDDDLKFYIRKIKQNNKKGRRRKKN